MIQNLEEKKCIDIFGNNYIGHLAFMCDGSPYVIPVTYYYDQKDNCIISYSEEGHKIKAMRKNPSVSFQVDEITSVNNWESVLAHGSFEELEGSFARLKLHQFFEGIKNIIARAENKKIKCISDVSSKIHTEGRPIVYRIKINNITGRKREYFK